MTDRKPLFFRRWSLRVQAAVLVIIPIMAVLFLVSVITYYNDRRIFEQQIELASIQLGEVLLGSLRYEMIHNNQDLLRSTLKDVLSTQTISRAWIVNLKGEVKISSDRTEEGTLDPVQVKSCQKCHQYPDGLRPRVLQDSAVDEGEMRIATPIPNDPQCWGCHPSVDKHLGMLLIDAPLVKIEQNLQSNLQKNLFYSALLSLLIGLSVYLMINTMIVSRIEHLHKYLIGYSRGDFRSRVPVDQSRLDEIVSLGITFNQMADRLEEHEQQVENNTRVREVAIVEERERIARELHDGIAQFLGYVITKTQAALLFLKKNNPGRAEIYLQQLEGEAQKQSIDIRASILGLKIFSSEQHSLAVDVRRSIEQSNRFMDLVVKTEVDDALENLVLAPETELQLLRIVQEGISNIRKHARAEKANVVMEYIKAADDHKQSGDVIRISIIDQGIGFDLSDVGIKGHPHFGLSTMKERAEAIGADFSVESTPGHGTKVTVSLKLKGNTL